MFFDKNLVSVNGNIARINAFYTKSKAKGAYVMVASQNGQDKNGNGRTNWIEFQAWGDKAQQVADVYRQAKQAPKGHKKVSVFAHIKTWSDKQNHNHMDLVINKVQLAQFGSKKQDAKRPAKAVATA